MALKDLNLELVIPDGVEVKIEGDVLYVKGKAGGIERNFYHPKISIKKTEKAIKIEGRGLNSKERIIVPTFNALIKNYLDGVNKPYTYELKICSGHFPIKATIEDDYFVIRNLFGEKIARKVKIPKNVKVNISGNGVHVESVDKEVAGQTAVSIERATIRPGFDKRIFQDGIYIVRKAEKNE